MNIDAAKAALAHLDLDENPHSVKAKSRDFFWYSPVLKDRLDGVSADFVVSPKSQDEVIEILRICHTHDVPVTVRGAGTGNYGQAMPLKGGCIIHMQSMNTVVEIGAGRVVTQPGVVIRELDAITREHSGQELRMMPSTAATATIGGFICGGSGGVGSVRWGVLRDYGNIIRIRVVTAEAEPRILDFTGEDLARVSHAYGTNGIVTEIELPLAPAYDWVHLFVTHPDFAAASRMAHDISLQDGLLIKLDTVCEAPIAAKYFQRFKGHVTEADNLVALMVAPQSMDGFLSLLAHYPEAKLIYRSDDNDWSRDPGPAYEYGWNHTTLRALKVEPVITYLQVRYAGEGFLDKIDEIRARFGDELIQHIEFLKENGVMTAAGLTLVRFTTEDRLNEIIAIHEEMGCMIFNPHRYTLEEGGRQIVDDRQLNFKREADPKGILNPGKMIAWEDPDWDFKTMYAYPDLKKA